MRQGHGTTRLRLASRRFLSASPGFRRHREGPLMGTRAAHLARRDPAGVSRAASPPDRGNQKPCLIEINRDVPGVGEGLQLAFQLLAKPSAHQTPAQGGCQPRGRGAPAMPRLIPSLFPFESVEAPLRGGIYAGPLPGRALRAEEGGRGIMCHSSACLCASVRLSAPPCPPHLPSLPRDSLCALNSDLPSERGSRCLTTEPFLRCETGLR